MIFFANIGPKLANQIKPISVSKTNVLKHLSSLRTKNSAGVDGISVKLFKTLSPCSFDKSTNTDH